MLLPGSAALAMPAKTLIATYVAVPPGSVAAGATFVVSVALTNTGTEIWKSTAPGLVNLSYHWYDPSGAPVVWDGARTAFGADIAPTQQRTVQLSIAAPATPGAFLLRLPARLHARATRQARRETRSLNSLLIVALQHYLKKGA